MTETLTVTTERVDDIPVLLTHMQRMNLPALLDAHFPAHGNWQGLSQGWTATVWLSYILSQADHRLNQVQAWADRRLQALRGCTGQPVRALDVSDDRLAGVLDALGNDDHWSAFETALNQHTIRVYDLTGQRVRLDSTTAKGYWTVTEEGLFQFGHSKDHRPDLPQVKVMLAALDPLGMPLATQVVSGEKADDPLYVPAIQAVREGLGGAGLLYVGDGKMMSRSCRGYLQAGGDFYLGPFSKVHLPDETLEEYLQPVWQGKQPLTPIARTPPDGPTEVIAEGYEREERVTAVVDGATVTWMERRLVVRSRRQARAGEAALRVRLAKAQAALEGLNERKQGLRRFPAAEPLRQAAEAIVRQYRVEGLLQVQVEETVQERAVRRYGRRPGRVQVQRAVRLRMEVDAAAVQQAVARLGWRVYGSNQPAAQLSLTQAVLAYREEYLVERSFGRLKGRPLSLTPMYVQEEQRATGLIRLLSVGLRVLTLLEFEVRRRLAQQEKTLSGLSAGNPKRATARPTAEALLAAFQEITLTVVQIGARTHRYITPLSDLQQKVLTLLDFPFKIYTRLAVDSCNPP
jgi:transposase